MKKIVAAVLAGAMLWQCCFAATTERGKSAQKVNNPTVEKPVMELSKIENGYAVIEAENTVLSNEAQIIADNRASGKKAVKFTNSTYYSNYKDCTDITMTVNVDSTDREGTYYVWVRKLTVGSGCDSMWFSATGKTYSYTGLGVSPNYEWVNIGSVPASRDVLSFYIKCRETGGTILDKFVVTIDPEYQPEGKNDLPREDSAEFNLWDDPEIKPEKGKHPRLYVNSQEDIERIKANAHSERMAKAYKKVVEGGNQAIDMSAPNSGTSTAFGSPKLTKIRYRALLRLIGEADDDHARQTIAYMREFLETVEYDTTAQDITRSMGLAIHTGAMVYDWCYDLMTEEDKEVFIKHFKRIASLTEIGYPPSRGSSIGSHSGEIEIHRGQLSAGIACYDEYEKMYNLAAGRMLQEFVESRKMFNKSGSHPNGNSYGFTRLGCEFWGVAAMRAMGIHDLYGEEMGNVSETWVYDRLPMGNFMRDGDEYCWGSYKNFAYSLSGWDNFIMAGMLYDNPNVTGEWVKESAMNSWVKDAEYMILFGNPESEWTYPDNSPLARATTYPLTSVTARTSWQNGINAPTAMVKMTAHELTLEDHMHKDVGSFQIYYKGMLAMDTGNYASGSGSNHNVKYEKSTVAHNAMLVHQPDEAIGNTVVQDGGQFPRLVTVVQTYEDLMDGTHTRAETKGVYIGPNEMTPKFSYLKTDLSQAYNSSKVDNYQRSMVFMDLFDEDYPAAFVVFDHIKSTDKTYEKDWLLHSEQEPVVEGMKTTIVRDTDGYNGKLVNTTMLPNNAVIDKVGGEGHEFEAGGVNYPYLTPEKRNGTDSGNWRIEVSPGEAQQEDVFLNAMYVTDADGNLAELPMIQEANGRFVGVTVKDRFVLFDKNGEQKSTAAFNVRDNGYSTVSCLIGDMDAGMYCVRRSDGVEIFVEVKEGENALYFEGAPGSYAVTEAKDGAVATAFTYPEMPKEKYGDFIIYHKDDALYHYIEKPNKLVDGVPYVAAEVVKEFDYIGTTVNAKGTPGEIVSDSPITVSYNGDSVTITGIGGTATYTVGENTYILNGEQRALQYAPFKDGNVIYIAAEDVADVTFTSITYDKFGCLLSVASQQLRADFQKKYGVTAFLPTEITAVGNDGNVEANASDWSLSTRWSVEGTNQWLMYDLGQSVNFDKVMIAFYNGAIRSTYFNLQVSNDGTNWETILADAVSSGTTGDFETFTVGDQTARYVRFVGNGNNLNAWNSVAEMVIAK